MKSYDELLKAEIEPIQQQIVAANKNERVYTLREVKFFYKELDFTVGMLKGSQTRGRNL